MAIDRAFFASECVNQGLYMGVPPHFLVGAAEFRSGISDDAPEPRIGPFHVTSDEWLANACDNDLEINLPIEMRSSWAVQCMFAALFAKRGMESFVARDGRYPNSVELYKELWGGDPEAQAASLPDQLQAALDKTAALMGAAFTEVLGAAPTAPTRIESTATVVPPSSDTSSGPEPSRSEQLFVEKSGWIMERLMDEFGLQDFQAAGILGNIGHECAGFQQFQELGVSGRGGFGWCQWTGPRRIEFERFCHDNGLSSRSDEANYGNLKRELRTTEKGAIAALKQSRSLSAAVRAFEGAFERARVKHFDRRERWATLALGPFRRALPNSATALLQADTGFTIVRRARGTGVRYWVIEEAGETPDQVLIEQRDAQAATVLKRETSVFPLAGLGLPASIVDELSRDVQVADATVSTTGDGSTGSTSRAADLLAEALRQTNRLVTKDVAGTHSGRLACAWAVNDIARRALGAPIGGGLSTTEMGKSLKNSHQELTLANLVGGAIVISPTTNGVVGHVGIVGKPAANLPETLIYSNSSAKGLFMQNYSIGRWTTRFKNRGLAVRFYLP
jgi:hypothetical protein